MDLKELQKHWNTMAHRDPLWSILTDPTRQHGGWDRDEFFGSGEWEVDLVLKQFDRLGVPPPAGTALDFGCGVGRLSQALARQFSRVVGVDISRRMLDLAREYNKHGDKVEYVHNEAPNLKQFENDQFDFIYSNIVLQHIEPETSKAYIEEFIRVLRPTGVLAFQLPSHPEAGRSALPRTIGRKLRRSAFKARIEPLRNTLVLTADTVATLTVDVTNEGKGSWPSLGDGPENRCAVNLGNHWKDEKGRMLVRDDSRASLPFDLEPGGKVRLEIAVNVPAPTGDYILELDMVQEHVDWFENRGSAPASVAVSVIPQLEGQVRHAEIEMHAIPRAQVESIIDDAGGVLLDAIPDDSPGASWVSFLYLVRKK